MNGAWEDKEAIGEQLNPRFGNGPKTCGPNKKQKVRSV
jgi:hypothetical protein